MASNVRAVSFFLLLSLAGCGSFHPFREGQAAFDTGLALFNQGKFEESVPYFERATVQNPDFAEAYLYLGRAQISLRHWREAIQPLRAAYRLAPGSTREEAFTLLMDALFAAGSGVFPPDRPASPPDRRDRDRDQPLP